MKYFPTLLIVILLVVGCDAVPEVKLYPYKITIEQDELDYGVHGDSYGLRGYKRVISRDTVMVKSDIEAYTQAVIKAKSRKHTTDRYKDSFGESRIYHIIVFDSLGNSMADKLSTHETDSIDKVIKGIIDNLRADQG